MWRGGGSNPGLPHPERTLTTMLRGGGKPGMSLYRCIEDEMLSVCMSPNLTSCRYATLENLCEGFQPLISMGFCEKKKDFIILDPTVDENGCILQWVYDCWIIVEMFSTRIFFLWLFHRGYITYVQKHMCTFSSRPSIKMPPLMPPISTYALLYYYYTLLYITIIYYNTLLYTRCRYNTVIVKIR